MSWLLVLSSWLLVPPTAELNADLDPPHWVWNPLWNPDGGDGGGHHVGVDFGDAGVDDADNHNVDVTG